MDIKGLTGKIKETVFKYKYAVVILLIGIGLLLIPQKAKESPIAQSTQAVRSQTIETDELTEILQAIEGAGKVKVLLSIGSGEQTIYQTNSEINTSGESNSTRYDAVVVTDAQRAETGLISQVNPPRYLGAIVVCEGADSATVRLAVTQAVARITGLGTDDICVLKME